MAIARITSRGRVTLPKQIREYLHVSAGDRVDFRIDERGEVRLLPVRVDTATDPLAARAVSLS